MGRWKAGVVACLILAGCGSDGKLIETVPAPELPTTTAVINTTTTEAAPETTVPATTTTEPDDEPTVSLVPVPTTIRARSTTTTAPAAREYLREEATTGWGPYNGWAIPEYIVACETGGTFSWTAYNPSGASGPYQLMPFHFGGELAMYQSQAAQHAKAAELWDGGRGRSHWAECL